MLTTCTRLFKMTLLHVPILHENNLSHESLECLIQAGSECQHPLNYDYVAFYFAGHGGIDDLGTFVVTSDNGHVNVHHTSF